MGGMIFGYFLPARKRLIEAQIANDPGRPTGGRSIGRNIRATAQFQSEYQ